MTMQKTTTILLFLTTVLSLLVSQAWAGASTYYVRPDDYAVGNNDGTSYVDAWQGLGAVQWSAIEDASKVDLDDTLFVAGTHLYDMTAWDSGAPADITPVSGTNDGTRLHIKSCETALGASNQDPGIIYGGHIPSYASVTQQAAPNDNVYKIDLTGATTNNWYFEDISGGTFTVLDYATSVANCQANPGSSYADLTNNDVYVHCSDDGDPTGRIMCPNYGYDFRLNGLSYITFTSITFYAPQGAFFISSSDTMTYITLTGCTIKYGCGNQICPLRDNCHYNKYINSEIGHGKNGIYTISNGNNAPNNLLVQGCYIHDIGNTTRTADGDAHGVGIQGGYDNVIEKNYLKDCGNTILIYVTDSQDCYDHTIRWNRIDNADADQSSNGKGIACQYNGTPGTITGCAVYGNLVVSAEGAALQTSWTSQVVFYNNTVVNCLWGLYTKGSNSVAIWKNNLVYNSTTYHAYAEGTDRANLLFDNNCYYPDGATMFRTSSAISNFATWDSNLDADDESEGDGDDSFIGDPSLSVTYTLQLGSTCIDTGENLGATYDDALDPTITWPTGTGGGTVNTGDQDSYGSGWEIGAFYYPSGQAIIITTTGL